MPIPPLLTLDGLGAFAHAHVGEISFAMATSLVIILSPPIYQTIKRVVRKWPFPLRYGVYILLFTLGYSLLAYYSERLLKAFLAEQKPVALIILTAIAFLGFGFWAEKQRNPG